MPAGPIPDFFIVGAPKSGTTAMCHYLQQHESIFMPVRKEAHYFGSDLTRIPHEFFVLEPKRYLAMFAAALPGRRIGEASVMYLFSRLAAQEIKAFNPDARIIVMLRRPAEMLYSYHGQLVWGAYEDIEDFGEALRAEPERRRGARQPRGNMMRECLYYRDVGRYGDQLERYFDVFGRERVHVILYDDFQRDPAAAFEGTLAFLGVAPKRLASMPVVNASKVVFSPAVTRMLQRPPRPMRWALNALSDEQRYKLLGNIQGLNSRYRSRPRLDPVLHKELVAEFRPQVEKLELLLSTDLSAWKN